MIYTKFGTPCSIIRAPRHGSESRVPVDIVRHGEDGKDRAMQTYVDELRADDGFAEIMAEIERVRAAG